MDQRPVLPDYEGACVANVVPALLAASGTEPTWLPAPVHGADRVVLLVLDGLGWNQLAARAASTPVLHAMTGGPVTTVAPTTTATALTSITTGAAPGDHGIMGYRMAMGPDVLNVLRWGIVGQQGRAPYAPEDVQPHACFADQHPSVVTRADFRTSGFSGAHLRGATFTGYRVTSTLVSETARLVEAGSPFTYVYYDGIDKVSHEYGLNATYDAEVAFVDRLVGELLEALPAGTALLVTSDHGQVHVGLEGIRELHGSLVPLLARQSGEGRFRWLHARSGRIAPLLDAAAEHHGADAWVVTRDQVVDEGWFGPKVSDVARGRLGDVALVARTPVSFHDPDDSGPFELIGRHGSMTADEVLVPLLAAEV